MEIEFMKQMFNIPFVGTFRKYFTRKQRKIKKAFEKCDYEHVYKLLQPLLINYPNSDIITNIYGKVIYFQAVVAYKNLGDNSELLKKCVKYIKNCGCYNIESLSNICSEDKLKNMLQNFGII